MKVLHFDAHQVWETTPVYTEEIENQIYTENHPFTTEESSGLFSVNRYWNRRHDFWPNFDRGICTDREGLFSVTPWDSAVQIAQILDNYYPKDSHIVVDACCGVGGNTTAFARCISPSIVIGVDADPIRIICAKRNSQVSGVRNNADFIRDNVFSFLNGLNHSVRFVFSSPPWGGPGYAIKCLEDFPFDMFAFFQACRMACVNGEERVCLFLPRNFSSNEAKRLAPKGTVVSKFDVTTGKQKRLIASCFMYGLKKG